MPDMTDAERLHAGAVVLDATCPIEHWADHSAAWREGGATCAVTVASTESARETLRTIASMYALLRERPSELRLATSVEDILEAKRRGELAVVFHFQGTEPIEYDVDLIEVFWRLGVRVIQLAYNRRNPLCDGCEEPVDAGLSTLGCSAARVSSTQMRPLETGRTSCAAVPNADTTIYDTTQVGERAIPRSVPTPEYPAEARRRRIQGRA